MRGGTPSERLRMRAHSVRGCTIVIAEGEIDLATRDSLRERLASCDGHVVIDLAGVSFLDSAGIGVIIAQRNRLLALGGSLVLRAPVDRIRKILETVGLAMLVGP
jgi:anti-anti-sigma factor